MPNPVTPPRAAASRPTVQQLQQQAKRQKYGNKKVVTEEGTFDSEKEYRRWCELKMLVKARQIYDLVRQPRFPLIVSPSSGGLRAGQPNVMVMGGLVGYKIGEYVADFSYRTSPAPPYRITVEDVKGFKTALYRWKKKHFEAQHGIEIREL